MACTAQVIQPGPADWGRLLQAAGDPAALDEIQTRYQTGQAAILKMSGDASGLVVVWAEVTDQGHRELVIALGVGSGARNWIPWAVEFAADNGAGSIRTHCRRAGLIRLYQNNGFLPAGVDADGYTILRR